MACVSEDLKYWRAWDTTCGHKAKDITPSIAWRREGALDDLLSKDERGSSSVRGIERRCLENVWEKGWSEYGLFWAHRYHFELNWAELNWQEATPGKRLRHWDGAHTFHSMQVMHHWGAGIAQWLERRISDCKVAGSSPGRSGGRIFFSRVNFLCWLSFRYPFQPHAAVARKRSRSFCLKCRWQLGYR